MPRVPHAREGRRAVHASFELPGRRRSSGRMDGAASYREAGPETGSRGAGAMTQAISPSLPCAACKQPVIEKRTLDGALVVLDAGTKRVHLCVKRKEVEAAKAKQMAASRAKASARPAPRPPVKRTAVVAPVAAAQPSRPPKQSRHGRGDRPRQPARATAVELPRKAARQRPRQTTLPSRAPV